MADNADKTGREARLAAKLRENLRRRKAQARALNDAPGNAQAGAPGLSKEHRDG